MAATEEGSMQGDQGGYHNSVPEHLSNTSGRSSHPCTAALSRCRLGLPGLSCFVFFIYLVFLHYKAE